MRSPLFGISLEKRAQLLRYKPPTQLAAPSINAPQGSSNMAMTVLTAQFCSDAPLDNMHTVDSIDEAEDLLFSQAGEVIEKYEALPFALRRQCSLLALKNRRGYANLIFTTPEIREQIPTHQLHVDKLNSGEVVGRWYTRGVLRKFDKQGSQLFVSDCVPQHTAFVAYKGASNLDSVGLLFKTVEELKLWCPVTVDIPSTIAHYITKITFET